MSKDEILSPTRSMSRAPGQGRAQRHGTLSTACALILTCSSILLAQTSPTTSGSLERVSRSASLSELTSSVAAPNYIISPDDVLSIKMYDAPDISGDYRVSSTGELELPLLSGAITVAGLTPSQLSQLIGAKYHEAEIFSRPEVTVAVKESRAHSIAITGAVKKPQIYFLFGKTTLLDVLSQAEGLADDASNTGIITRGAIATRALMQAGKCDLSSGQTPCSPTFTVDLKRLMETGDPNLNVELYPGDRITVQRAGVIYVVGAVNRAGGFPLRSDQEEMTVLQALALAEDLKPTALRSKAKILRKNPQAPSRREEIPVDLKKVLTGRAADPCLLANDILYVPDSVGKKGLRRGAEAAVYITTGLIIWRR